MSCPVHPSGKSAAFSEFSANDVKWSEFTKLANDYYIPFFAPAPSAFWRAPTGS